MTIIPFDGFDGCFLVIPGCGNKNLIALGRLLLLHGEELMSSFPAYFYD